MPISCTPLRIIATGRALPSQRVSYGAEPADYLFRMQGRRVFRPNALHVELASGWLGPGKRALLLGTAAGMSLGGLVLDH